MVNLTGGKRLCQNFIMTKFTNRTRITTFIQGLLHREPDVPLDAALKARIARSLVERIHRNPVEGEKAVCELLDRLTDLQDENKVLREAALTDALTGAHNHRSFQYMMKDLQEENIDKDRRKTGNHFILLIDLDGFKNINDTYGHAAGDAALCHVVQSLKKITRKTDAICRIGGDEFVVILKNANKDGAHKKIIQISDMFDDMSFDHEGVKGIPVRASLGWAEIQPEVFVKDIMKKIDDYVYEAKRIKGNTRFSSLKTPNASVVPTDTVPVEAHQSV